MLFLFILPTFGIAQTFTLTQSCGGAKNLGYALCQYVSPDGSIEFDNRGATPGGLFVQSAEFNGDAYHGVYSGFVANPDGSHSSYYGNGSYTGGTGTDSNNLPFSATASLPFYARYVGSCSGRGCAGTTIGWHFTLLPGGTVTISH
jgi:hypothetical protein